MSWQQALIRRLLHALSVVVLATTIGFVVLRSMPGGPFAGSAEQSSMTQESLRTLRARFGVDRNIPQQYASYLYRISQGDLGQSTVSQRPVADLLAPAVRNTMLLCGCALLLALAMGISVGVVQGWRPESRLGQWSGRVFTTLYVIPEFVIAIVLLTIFALRIKWFPLGGIADPLTSLSGSPWEKLADRARHLVLPSCTLALGWAAVIARQQRVALLDVRNADWIRSAYARGLRERRILIGHALPMSLSGVVAVTGYLLPVVASGALVVELLFAWPGTGTLIVQSIVARDYPLVSAAIITTATMVAFASLAVDAVALWLDPRQRHLDTAANSP